MTSIVFGQSKPRPQPEVVEDGTPEDRALVAWYDAQITANDLIRLRDWLTERDASIKRGAGWLFEHQDDPRHDEWMAQWMADVQERREAVQILRATRNLCWHWCQVLAKAALPLSPMQLLELPVIVLSGAECVYESLTGEPPPAPPADPEHVGQAARQVEWWNKEPMQERLEKRA